MGTKRKGTYYYQAWHGSISLKPIAKYCGNQFSKITYMVSKADSDLMNLAASGDRWCTEMWSDGLIYGGEIKQFGLPRCVVIVNTNSRIVDVTQRADMNEIMASTDAIITD